MENGEIGAEQLRPREVTGYRALKELSRDELAAGNVVVHDLRPYRLWASQDWTAQDKIVRAGNGSGSHADNSERVFPAYYRDMPTGQRAVILGDGHHGALLASEQGKTVSVRIIGSLPEDRDFLSFSRFRRENGNPFRE